MIKSLATKATFAAGAATVAISAVSAPAEAATVTPYTDRAAWEAQLNILGWSASPQEQFNTNIANAASITFANGVVSQGFDGSNRNDVNNGVYRGNLRLPSTVNPPFSRIEWTFPSTRGFGADWTGTSNSAGLRVTIAGQTIVFGDVPGFTGKNAGETGFLGFISDTPFTLATFDVAFTPGFANESYLADNLSYAQFNGDPAVVPTPALLPGLIGMGIAAWRKRKGEATESEV